MTNPADSRSPEAPSGETLCPACGLSSLMHGYNGACAEMVEVPVVTSSAPSGEPVQREEMTEAEAEAIFAEAERHPPSPESVRRVKAGVLRRLGFAPSGETLPAWATREVARLMRLRDDEGGNVPPTWDVRSRAILILADELSRLQRDRQEEISRVVEEGARAYLLPWAREVVRIWRQAWEPRTSHRYGRDFAAFLGERLLTDFDLREIEPPNPSLPPLTDAKVIRSTVSTPTGDQHG